MSDFGYGGRRFEHRRHHHWRPWDQGAVGDFAPPVLDDDAGQDFGCDPMSPGFRVFGQDDDDATQPQDDDSGGQGGVLDAAVQVAQGIPDVILPPVLPVPVPGDRYARFRHHRHHPLYLDPRFDPNDHRWDARLWGRLPLVERDRYRRIWAARGYRFHGDEFGGQWMQTIENAAYQAGGGVPQPPWQRYGHQGYRPRGPKHHWHHPHPGMTPPPYGMGPGMGPGYPTPPMGLPPSGMGPGMGPGFPGVGPGMGHLPPGSYQQTCQGCNYDGGTLTCQCQTIGGQMVPTSLQTDWTGHGQSISNHNGQLVNAPV